MTVIKTFYPHRNRPVRIRQQVRSGCRKSQSLSAFLNYKLTARKVGVFRTQFDPN